MKTSLIILFSIVMEVIAAKSINGKTKGLPTGCVYKSQIYQEGQTWKDGCDYICQCVDDSTGKYTCNQLCSELKLPPQCHMQPPTAGECCGNPFCPDGVAMNYPLGYIEQ